MYLNSTINYIEKAGVVMPFLIAIGIFLYFGIFCLILKVAKFNFKLNNIQKKDKSYDIYLGEKKDKFFNKIKLEINFLFVLAGICPLLGLLGTVNGMLNTFKDLQNALSIEKLVAGGISEALITTQTGLIISIIAYCFIFFLRELILTANTKITNLKYSQN